MTEITYKNGYLSIIRANNRVRLRPCDLEYEDVRALALALADLAAPQLAGAIGFLKTQPVEVRQQALEEALGVSFPLGMGD